MAYRTVLTYPAFRNLWMSTGVAAVGNRLFEIAFVWLLFEFAGAGNPTLFAIALAVVALPEILSTLVAGVAADRWNRLRVIAASQLLRAALLFLVPLFAIDNIAALVTIGALIGLVGAFEGPARSAVVPNLVPDDKLDEANGILQLLNVCSRLLYVVSGALVMTVGAPTVIFLSAFPFTVSATLLLFVPDHMSTPDRSGSVDDVRNSIRDDVADVVSIFRSNAVLRSILLLQIVHLFIITPVGSIILPIFSVAEFGGDSMTYGVLYGAYFAGMFFSAGFYETVIDRDLAHGQMVVFGTIVSGLFLAAMAVAPSTLPLPLVSTVVLHGLAGMATFYALISVQTLLQMIAADSDRAKVFSVLSTVGVVVAPISYLTIGPIVSSIGAVSALFAIGLLSAAVGVIAVFTPLYDAEVEADTVFAEDAGDSPFPSL